MGPVQSLCVGFPLAGGAERSPVAECSSHQTLPVAAGPFPARVMEATSAQKTALGVTGLGHRRSPNPALPRRHDPGEEQVRPVPRALGRYSLAKNPLSATHWNFCGPGYFIPKKVLLTRHTGFFLEANHAPSMPDALGSIPSTRMLVCPRRPLPSEHWRSITPALPMPSLHFLKPVNLYGP